MSQASISEIARVIRGLMTSKDSAQKIASYLVSERRTGDTERIMREVERQQQIEDGVVEVVATSARPLTEDVKRQISLVFEGNEVKIIERRDETLVGGVHIKSLDSMADLSVRGRLKALKGSLKG